jgi:hypothetical protein
MKFEKSNCILKILIFFFLMIHHTSCNEIEKIKDIIFDVTLQQQFSVITSKKTNEVSDFIDPTSNKDFNDNKNKISNLEVSQITYQILSLDTTQGFSTKLVNGYIDFEKFDRTGLTRLASMSDVDLNQLSKLNVETPIILEHSAKEKLASSFSISPYKVKVTYLTESDQDRSNFIILFRYKLRLKSKL